MRAKHDWKILVPIFGLFCVVVMALNLYFIYRLSKGELFLSLSEDDDIEIMNQKRAVQKINNDFARSAAELVEFETGQ